MDSKEFFRARKKLEKTQKQMAELLGSSIKAIHSYEQGWRSIPGHVERQVFFLISRQRDGETGGPQKCWTAKKCPPQRKKQCPAWEFRAGELCWFINGTICECTAKENWKEKMKICRKCKVLAPAIAKINEPE